MALQFCESNSQPRQVVALQDSTTMAHYRSDCREVFISPRHIFVGRPIAPNYLGDRAYARTLTTACAPRWYYSGLERETKTSIF